MGVHWAANCHVRLSQHVSLPLPSPSKFHSSTYTLISNTSNFNPHAPTHPKNLTILSGATSLLSTLALTLANPGEAVLLPAPCYVGFLSDLSLLAGLTPVYVRFLSPVDQFTDVDHAIRCFEEARERAEEQGTNVKMVVLCNPHNPLGRCYTKDMLMGVMRFCGKWGIHLVVDEVYAMSVYSTACATDIPFTSILSLNSTPHIAPTHLHQIYSLSKDFASGGLRIASLHTHNNLLQRAISRLAILHHSGTIPSLLAIAILSPPPPSTFHNIFFTTSRARLARAAELAKSLLDEAGIRYASSSNAGFFLWIDLRPWLRGEEEDDEWEREKGLSARMEVEKVFIIGGRVQGAGEAGWYRFIFSRNEQVVREGVERLVRALGKRA